MDPAAPASQEILATGLDEDRMRRALLHMLEDLQRDRKVLRETSRRWVQTVDAIDMPILVRDAAWCVVRANRAYARRAHMRFNEMLGRPYWECFPRIPGVKEGMPTEVCLETGETLSVHTYSLNESGDEPKWLHVFEDVTTVRRIEIQSRVMLELTSSRHVLEGNVEAVAREITEAAARVTGAARANAWLFNDAEDELHCVDLYEAATGRHSAGMVLREHEFRNEFEALKKAPYVDASDPLTDPRTRGYAKDYLKQHGITSMLDTVIEVSGRHIGVLCIEHVGHRHVWAPDEITFAARIADKLAAALFNRGRMHAEQSLRDSEKRFRTMFEESPLGVTESALDGRYLSTNRRMCEITGYSEEELKARTFHDITHPEDVARDAANLQRMVAGEIATYRAEKRYIRKDGRTVWVALLVTPVRDATNVTRYLFTNVEDITARKQGEHALRAQLAELQRWQELNLDREDRVLELKHEINGLLGESGRAPRYPSAG